MNSPVRVKICGITSEADAEAAVAAGADAIGLVFYSKSPRYVEPQQAAAIARIVGPFVTVVGLFVNESATQVKQLCDEVGLHLLQFHGDEDEQYCRHFGQPYMKALRMKPELDVAPLINQYPSAAGILLDAYRPGVPGGTGETFDWQRVPRNPPRPLVLAGGLNPENVAVAVQATGVYGVDVSGGVESSPGQKDAEKIATFVRRAKTGENSE
ncbi:phosphoribosylanthranilate isomerase [Pseudomaricurvus alkylphenolicus]|uniref:phosphoribosylanthranilate isomerase n=1 Tax=Pseudomaricurvus alkylphenolicus TaxID=1306991 RepID=UPI00141F6DA0|nr:phosphoribosylanthranilate isomerase [Pseudomaricurvus alkylphenolicus]NIB41331.1 phosphoribosylanthranilate isomerase [Pseudomaricurvus alkylphenolicus]